MAALEKRAASTSFAQLYAFGEAASVQMDEEGLRKLQHTFTIYLNQGESEKAIHWNTILANNARQLRNKRFQDVARLNAYLIAYNAGEKDQPAKMRRLLDQTDDWYVHVTAARYYASTCFDDLKIGEGLELLSAAQAQIPVDDPEATHAHAGIWEMVGIGLMDLHDIRGATEAFTHYEMDYGHEDWPRPDYDSLYNLTTMAIQVGDIENAERYFALHDRLSKQADLPGLRAYNALMCARVANMSDDMPRVLDCMVNFESQFEGEPYLQLRAWPLKSIALSRLGRPAEAERILKSFEALNTTAPGTYLHNLGLKARAEFYYASGRTDEAMRLMRLYIAREVANEARSYGEGVYQVTKDKEQQLLQRRHQLEIEQANVQLQGDMIRTQMWVVSISLFFLFCGGVALIMMWVQANALRAARRKAEEANTAKSLFLANMSHEIRTPLNGVVAMADVLQRRELAPKDKELVDIIRSSAGTLGHLLNDILDSARIESGEMTLEIAPFNLQQLLDDVRQLWMVRAADKGLEMQVTCAPELNKFVLGDANRLKQVLNNLVSNALKFTDQGVVKIEAKPDDGGVVFSVEDTGVGFEAEFRERVFGRFQQADTSITRRYGGSGLGLNISKNLVFLMDGQMDCSSVPGVGARFWFRVDLPDLKSAHDEQALVADVRSEKTGQVSQGLGLSILLADDNAANRKVVEIILSSMDAELVSAVNGEQAVEAFQNGFFDLVLMDMQMPVMDGLTAIRHIREIEKRDGRIRTPVIMLTANAMSEHVEASMEAGADRHLAKPLTVKSLMEAIHATLELPEAE